jgi:hypothetical protein
MPWLPPVYEFAVEMLDPPSLVVERRAAPLPVLASSAGTTQRVQSAAALVVFPAPTAQARPAVLVIGQRGRDAPLAEDAAAAGHDAARLGEPQALVEALPQSLTDHRDGTLRPLLALGPAPLQPPAPSAAPGTGMPASSGRRLAELSIPAGGDLVWDDGAATQIDSIERKLSLQIQQHRSTSVIAGTRFALAQAIWDSSVAASSQSRALALARQSKAALATVPARLIDPSVAELQQNVDDWLNQREGPVEKPHGGRLVLNPHLDPPT